MKTRGRRVAIGVAGVGLLLAIAAAVALLKDFLLVSSYEARLQGDPDAEGNWELSQKLEGFGERGRNVAESWYLQGLDRWASRGDIDNVLAAIVRLGEIRSRRAIPVLGRFLANRDEEASLSDLVGVGHAENAGESILLSGPGLNPPSVEIWLPLRATPEIRLSLQMAAGEALRKIEEPTHALPR